MIPLKIEGKTYKIPTYSERTLKQYADVSNYDNINYARYISIVTGLEVRVVMNMKINKLDLLNKMLGNFLFICGSKGIRNTIEYNDPKDLKFVYQEKLYDFSNEDMMQTGYRILFEQYLQKKPQYLDGYVYTLAMLIDGNFDSSNIESIKKNLYEYNAYEVLSLGAFFFEKWRRGARRDPRFLSWLIKIISILTKPTKSKLVLRDWRNTQQ